MLVHLPNAAFIAKPTHGVGNTAAAPRGRRLNLHHARIASPFVAGVAPVTRVLRPSAAKRALPSPANQLALCGNVTDLGGLFPESSAVSN